MDKKPRKSSSGSTKQSEPNTNVKHFASPAPQRSAVRYAKGEVVYASSKIASGNSVEQAHKQSRSRRHRS
jgi:hypothetical protein